MHFLQIVWDPASEGIKITDSFTIHYYSLMWILAFLIGYTLMKRIFKHEKESQDNLDSLFIYSVLGLLLGARLGEVFFYSWDYFKDHLVEILLPIREDPNGSILGIKGYKFYGFRGLASHGAAVGMIISMYLYNKKKLKRSVLWILDRIVIPVAIGAIFVRIGNFFNSEMIGKKVEEGSFGIIFRQYDDFVRHPGQLYEAFGYIFVFAILYYFYWKTDKGNKLGFLFGTFLVLLFSIRLFVERFKIPQVEGREDWLFSLNTGQALSIPFILLGLYFMFIYKPKRN
ncbi:MAG: prolipoprotein diacylglyceryl transferase [Flavobacteriaceae bacterium]|nr:prolipoprotein diacylglyceryl transferase [Bacteroidia bacterium]MBT8286803.1 prolipoprotein diacylglyceryl transferase [Bacteroidia bacterium]NNF74242.1 prolipoprotein diacylglyceryl transferase [Flavobacteriaceae bacterium]NNK71909.1 prolipoprotein diacylglyceryl transferase [Flavobacteriaceae bacterium]